MSDYEDVIRDHIERLAAEADIPLALLEGVTSAEAFESIASGEERNP